MSITIKRSIDIEDVVRGALAPYMTAYCPPLPKTVALPSIEVEMVGGSNSDTIDRFDIVLDARAEREYDALELMRNAIGILKKVASDQTTAMHYCSENTKPVWIEDPTRPDVAMCRARLMISAHEETETLE